MECVYSCLYHALYICLGHETRDYVLQTQSSLISRLETINSGHETRDSVPQTQSSLIPRLETRLQLDGKSTLKTSWLFQPQSCYPGCRQTGEIVVMRGLRQLPSSSYKHNTLKTLIIFVVPSPGYNFLTAIMKCICNDSFTDILRVASVLWL